MTGLIPEWSSAGGEKQLIWVYVETVKNDSQVFGLCNWMVGVALEIGKAVGGACLRGKIWSSCEFKTPH